MSGQLLRVASVPGVMVSAIHTFRESVGRKAIHVTDITFQSTVVTVCHTLSVLSACMSGGIMWSFMTCTRHQILFGDHTEEKEMGGTCGTYGGQDRCIRGFGRGNLREKNPIGISRCR